MWPDSFPVRVRILPISGLSVKDFWLTFSLAIDMEGGKYLEISFKLSCFKGVRLVTMGCKMTVINRMGQSIKNTLDLKRNLGVDEEWNLPPYFTEKLYQVYANEMRRLFKKSTINLRKLLIFLYSK
ncbi:hypothetical protein TNIN_195271 [Trichonephila inaurata madagascariensis]|uniref:Uncharacterized protein n=1 Tax=Trichonephila inaurata madagascariensis TaxID=2747483 RepID=A0A8X7C9W1_9ARAC|nr:hypothetical protein TNIN_195271 [Trichonephila inaurata madagascariensis]